MKQNDIEVHVADDVNQANVFAAETIVAAAEAALAERERFVIALSGGKSPQPVYRMLATTYRDRIDWARTHVWFGDERCVIPDDPASNYGMAKASLLDHVGVPEAQVHRLAGEMVPGEAAWLAHQELGAFAAALGGGPIFDVMMIGAGPDGHTASLFPEHRALAARDRLVVHSEAPAPFEVRDRLTMTLPALGSSRLVLLLATGGDKRGALHAAHDGDDLPVGMVRGRERTLWIVDRAAWE